LRFFFFFCSQIISVLNGTFFFLKEKKEATLSYLVSVFLPVCVLVQLTSGASAQAIEAQLQGI
jgi:hypothetical protein